MNIICTTSHRIFGFHDGVFILTCNGLFIIDEYLEMTILESYIIENPQRINVRISVNEAIIGILLKDTYHILRVPANANKPIEMSLINNKHAIVFGLNICRNLLFADSDKISITSTHGEINHELLGMNIALDVHNYPYTTSDGKLDKLLGYFALSLPMPPPYNSLIGIPESNPKKICVADIDTRRIIQEMHFDRPIHIIRHDLILFNVFNVAFKDGEHKELMRFYIDTNKKVHMMSHLRGKKIKVLVVPSIPRPPTTPLPSCRFTDVTVKCSGE